MVPKVWCWVLGYDGPLLRVLSRRHLYVVSDTNVRVGVRWGFLSSRLPGPQSP